MPTLTKAALALTACLATTAYAQAAEPWVLNQNMAYMVDAKGNTVIVDLGKMNPKMKKKAHAVPKNTVFYMQGGKLMMADWPTGQ